MKGFIEVEVMMEGVPEATGTPAIIAVSEIVSVMDVAGLPEKYHQLFNAEGIKSAIVLRNKDQVIPTSCEYSLVRDLIRACVGA